MKIGYRVIFLTGVLHSACRAVDGFICTSTPEIDGTALEALEADLGVPCLGIG